MKKRLLSLVLALATCLSLCTTVFAKDTSKKDEEVGQPFAEGQILQMPIVQGVQLVELTAPEYEVNNGQFGGMYYVKMVTSEEYGWSDSKRVSDDLNGSVAGGTISTNKEEEVKFTLTGAYKGLTFEGEKIIKSAIGYTLNVPAGVTAHIEFRARMKIEKGKRLAYSIMTDKLLKSESYTAKFPMYGEYRLVITD